MDPNTSILIVTAILLAALFFLITEKIPVDRVAIGLMVILSLTGILTPTQAVAGFANPALITVGAMFLVSRGMMRTGAVEFIAAGVLRFSRGSSRLAVIVILLMVALSSAFINNTPVVILFIPIVMGLSCEYNLRPSKLLIPVSYASILAGTCTLIGTSTNIIVSDLSAAYGYGPLGMFELAGLGVLIAAAGLVFILLAGPRLMPAGVAPVCEVEQETKRYLAELEVMADSRLIGRDPVAALQSRHPTLELIEVIRESHIFDPHREPQTAAAGDILLVKSAVDDLLSILQNGMVKLPHAGEGIAFGRADDDLIVELIIPPHSSLVRRRLLSTELQGDPQIHIIAIKSRQSHYSEQKIQNVKLRLGDIVLVRCPAAKLDRLRQGNDFIILEDVHHAIIDKSKARWAVAIFAGIVAGATSGVAGIMECALAGVLLMAATRCIRLRDAYRYLEPDVLLLIAGTIALGSAMEKTGATVVYARGFLDFFHGAGPQVVLAGFMLLTSISTQILSNNATAVLLLPIAITTAQTLGVDPKPFIIAVCYGASACFATPIGYQTNLLVYGPGGYRFSDYLKLGLPLNLLVLALGTLFIPRIWPF